MSKGLDLKGDDRLLVFYASSAGRSDVPAHKGVELGLAEVIAIYRSLVPCRGYLCLCLQDGQIVQLLMGEGKLKVELLDCRQLSLEWCVTEPDFGEVLVEKAGADADVFAFARSELAGWTKSCLMPPSQRESMD